MQLMLMEKKLSSALQDVANGVTGLNINLPNGLLKIKYLKKKKHFFIKSMFKFY